VNEDCAPGSRATTWAARGAVGGLGGVVAFQAAVALGAPWGEWTQGGGTVGRLPVRGRVLAVVSAALLTAMALNLLARAGEGPMTRAPHGLVAVLAWATTVFMGLSVALNLASPSARERALWAPVTAALFALTLFVVLTTRTGQRHA
jgi:hypothetical protein